jgi:hypothetical protein
LFYLVEYFILANAGDGRDDSNSNSAPKKIDEILRSPKWSRKYLPFGIRGDSKIVFKGVKDN